MGDLLVDGGDYGGGGGSRSIQLLSTEWYAIYLRPGTTGLERSTSIRIDSGLNLVLFSIFVPQFSILLQKCNVSK